jgi:2-dehydropantoate 2-reductase
VLVARGPHLTALQEDGLELAMPDRVLRVRPPATTLEDLHVEPGDAVLLGVKSQHTEAALATLAAKPVADRTAGEVVPVFCVQNGISNEDTASRFFALVHGVGVNIPATHLEPGRVDAEGAPFSGALQVGRYPQGLDPVDDAVVEALRASGFDAVAQADVMAWKRAKLLRNVGNALDVLFRLHDEPPLTDDEKTVLDDVATRARDEARACLRAAGLSVISDADYAAAVSGRAVPTPVGDRPRRGGSTWQSVARGQGSVETDFLNGEIVRLGRLHGVGVEVNETIQARMRNLGSLDRARPWPPRASV